MILDVQDVSIKFGGITALEGCSLSVEKGTIIGLIGPNGAGKTTLLNVIAGFYRQNKGRIIFLGEKIDNLPPYKRVLKGIVMTFQIPRELRKLTVLENLLLCRKGQSGEKIFNAFFRRKSVRFEENKNYSNAMQVLNFLRLEHLADEHAMSLSSGQKKLLEIGRALMVDAQVLLLDEPFAGVHPKLGKELARAILELRNNGKTIITVEHNIEMIMQLTDFVYFMYNGQILSSGEPQKIIKDERVIKAYLGG